MEKSTTASLLEDKWNYVSSLNYHDSCINMKVTFVPLHALTHKLIMLKSNCQIITTYFFSIFYDNFLLFISILKYVDYLYLSNPIYLHMMSNGTKKNFLYNLFSAVSGLKVISRCESKFENQLKRMGRADSFQVLGEKTSEDYNHKLNNIKRRGFQKLF